jgi:hypothetical protein
MIDHTTSSLIGFPFRNTTKISGANDMARKKATNRKTDRTDPKNNKSLAIRTVLKKMPTAKAKEVAGAVKKEFGHDVSSNMVYMVKTKANMASDGRPKKAKSPGNGSPMKGAALWVDAIKTARQLLKQTGSVANATALLKAIDG